MVSRYGISIKLYHEPDIARFAGSILEVVFEIMLYRQIVH